MSHMKLLTHCQTIRIVFKNTSQDSYFWVLLCFLKDQSIAVVGWDVEGHVIIFKPAIQKPDVTK